MGTRHDNVDHTFEAVSRLRRLLHEHDTSGEDDTPFHAGIRDALAEIDAGEREEPSAA